MSSAPVTLVYQNGQATALIAIVLFAFISLLAIFGVLARYSWDPLMNLVRRRRQGASPHHSRAFFHTQLGAYIASLMLSNALSSISMIINVQWAADKRVTDGMLCNTQGILMQIGDTGGAYFTGAIAIHTFNTLVLRNKLPGWTCLAASIWGWLVAILLAATPTWIRNPVLGPIYGINGLSCGIAVRWSLLNMVLHILPILLGSLVSVVVFTLVFLVLRGTLTIKDGIKFNINRQHRWSMSSVTTIEYQRFIAAVARSMLWYPFAFNILLLPEIVVGLMESSGLNVPFEALVFATTLAALLGAANSLILCNTLRILRPFLEGNLTLPSKKGRDDDMESFFAGAKSPRAFGSPSPTTPRNPEKAFIARDSKQEWTPSARSASKPEQRASVGQSVARNLSRVSRAISLKRKPVPSPPAAAQQQPSAALSRPITPVAELNAMITVPEPAFRKNTLPSSPRLRDAPAQIGLPAPRRDTRSPVVRRPTLSITAEDEAQMTTISLNTPEPQSQQAKDDAASDGTETRHTSANESLLSMYLSRSPEQEEMAKPPVPPKDRVAPAQKPKPQPMPLSARPPLSQSSLAPSPLPTLRSARIPAPYAPSKEAFANTEWAERVAKAAASRRGATPSTATLKTERRRSRSLDLDAASLAPRTPMGLAARTPTYGNSLTPSTPRRDPSLSAVTARSPLSARRMPPSRAGSLTPAAPGYGGYL